MIVDCECGGKVNTEAASCPHCGKPGPFKAAPPAMPRRLPADILLAVALSLAALLALLWLMN